MAVSSSYAAAGVVQLFSSIYQNPTLPKLLNLSASCCPSPPRIWVSAKQIVPIQAVSSVNLEVEEVEVSTSEYENFSVITSENEGNKLKICVEVSGARTQKIYDDVFSKMVAAAQPIPGFRRVKGGKTPDIPKDILLEVLGPSKVYTEVIKKVIDSTLSEYVKKEGLTVRKNVRVEQSLEDLEATFEPGDSFTFAATVHCQPSP